MAAKKTVKKADPGARKRAAARDAGDARRAAKVEKETQRLYNQNPSDTFGEHFMQMHGTYRRAAEKRARATHGQEMRPFKAKERADFKMTKPDGKGATRRRK